MEITRSMAERVLTVVDVGLVKGKGVPEPGKMCVEAAVCYALGLPHSDHPAPVAPSLQSLKIPLNDADWSSPAVRARGLRRLALAQLNSAGVLDEHEFVKRLALMVIRQIVPRALRAAQSLLPKSNEHFMALEIAALECTSSCDLNAAERAAESAASAAESAAIAAVSAAVSAASAAESAARAAVSAARAESAARAAVRAARAERAARAAKDTELAYFAEQVLQILIAMDAPGCQWLDLAPIEDTL